MTRVAVMMLLALALGGCESMGVPPPRVALPWQTTADVAGPSPIVPLVAPTTPVHCQRGRANVAYPASFAIAIRPDGSIAFPKNTSGRVRAGSVVAGNTVLATVNDAGEVSGAGLKRKYAFNDKGELVDDLGHGVRIAPDGRVRALGGSIRYADVLACFPEARGERWDYSGWRTLSILSLLVLENLLPETVGLTETTSAHTKGRRP